MKKIINTNGAPEALGPYSQAVAVETGRTLFLSGQIPLDPNTGELVEGDMAVQTARVMKNLGEILKAGGADYPNIVKTTIYLISMDDFGAVNETYGSFFGDNPPARATVQVSRLPKDARVEIDAVAVVPNN